MELFLRKNCFVDTTYWLLIDNIHTVIKILVQNDFLFNMLNSEMV